MSRDAAVIDRAGWPTGPWDAEPDRIEWKTSAGHVGLIVRQPRGGHLCGYVGVEPGHPWHSKGYDEVHDISPDIEPHGGLTYAAECFGHVCHVPEPGQPEHLWWLGFDAAHCYDLRPGDKQFPGFEDLHSRDVYRSVAYMRAHVEALSAHAALAK